MGKPKEEVSRIEKAVTQPTLHEVRIHFFGGNEVLKRGGGSSGRVRPGGG